MHLSHFLMGAPVWVPQAKGFENSFRIVRRTAASEVTAKVRLHNCYSSRKAIAGSVLMARCPGTKQAIAAVTNNNAETAAYVNRSIG